MRQWELIVQIYALLSLSVEARSTEGDDMIEVGDPNINNIVRAGRSIPTFTAAGDQENSHDTSYETETSKPDGFLRKLKSRDNFIRFGRGGNDNFMRFGRGKQDNFMRFGRNAKEKETDEYDRSARSAKGNKKSESDKFERLTKNFIRLGRGKQDNFLRFGRGKQDNFMRFGRGKQDNFIRLGRGKQDNFMRFGRGKQENFMRFGRGKQDNFMRFGRGKGDNYLRFGRDLENLDLLSHKYRLDGNDLLRGIKGKDYNFGKYYISRSNNDNIPIAMRSLPIDYNSFDRIVRTRQGNFLRFGKSDIDQETSKPLQFSKDLQHNPSLNADNTIPLSDAFTRVMKSKIINGASLLRQGRRPPNKEDSFIRFGRDSDNSLGNSLLPQRLKRSTVELPEGQEDLLPSKLHERITDHMLLPVFSLSDYREDALSSSEQQEGYNHKRVVEFKPPQSSHTAYGISSLDDVWSKLLVDPDKLTDLFAIPLYLTPTSSSLKYED